MTLSKQVKLEREWGDVTVSQFAVERPGKFLQTSQYLSRLGGGKGVNLVSGEHSKQGDNKHKRP